MAVKVRKAQLFPQAPATEAIRNMNHNLLHSITTKSDSVWRYDRYIEDASNCDSCRRLWQQLQQEDIRHLQLLRDEIAKHVQQGIFD